MSSAIADLRQRILDAGLVSESVLDQAIAQLTETTPESLIDALLAKNLLTEYQAGRLLAGHTDGYFLEKYKLLEQLDASEQGMVFLAEHVELKRTALVRVLPDACVQDAERFAEFQREARAIAALEHPNLVSIYDVGESRGRRFLISESVRGITLSDYVSRMGQFHAADALNMAHHIAEGLDYALQRNVVFDSLSPNQVHITSVGMVKVAHAGLDRFFEDQPSLVSVAESLPPEQGDYVAPEHRTPGAQTDVRSALYSLGCLMYLVLTTRPPFAPEEADDDVAVLAGYGGLVSLVMLRPDLPPNVLSLAEQLMLDQPMLRPETPRALMDKLKAIREVSVSWGQPLTPPPSSEASAVDESADSEDSSSTEVSVGEAALAERRPDNPLLNPPFGMSAIHRRWLSPALWLVPTISAVVLAGILTVMILGPLVAGRPIIPPRPPKPPDRAAATQPSTTRPSAATAAAGRVNVLDVGPGKMSLAQAIAKVGSGQTIEIHTSGPIPLEATLIRSKSVTIKGALGVEPVIVFSPTARAPGSILFRVDAGHLTLEGLHVTTDAKRPPAQCCFIRSRGSKLNVNRCSFTFRGPPHTGGRSVAISIASRLGVQAARASRGARASLTLIENCTFRNERIAIKISGHRHQITLDNCACLGRGAMMGFELGQRDPVDAVHLRISRCTAVTGSQMFELWGQRPSGTAVRITCKQTLLLGVRADAVMMLTNLPPAPARRDPIPVFAWEGDRNLYQGFRWLWGSVQDGTVEASAQSLEAWRQRGHRDPKSHAQPLTFQVRADAPVDRLSLRALRDLRTDSPHAQAPGAVIGKAADIPDSLLDKRSWQDLAPHPPARRRPEVAPRPQ